ncbi:hypothetical protein PHLGIDRAFT_400060 [Phlebiopsis gigantea 11061_1 CR5-6]|uniref:Chromatin remodeling factor mit1 n=1 Tax=Phlebiopsis gigantea (strain 11061_1 CR5-6) TaxID=745531 RepID=A0A0C3P2D9_PHLG1|nr:hypothetical protein PHLGIDRAFT_400060 [Phlebiopsis gigantea 11061_1 CR5-6]
MAHRKNCEKCEREPTQKLLQKAKKLKPRKRKTEDDFEDAENEQDRIASLGGWVRCLRCPVVAHWGCLAKTQRDEILKAIHEKDLAKWEVAKAKHTEDVEMSQDDTSDLPMPKKRLGLEANETTEFVCGSCMKGGICMICKDVAIQLGGVLASANSSATPSNSAPVAARDDVVTSDHTMDDVESPTTEHELPNIGGDDPKELLYRCRTCKRLAHYAHLPLSRFADPSEKYTAEDLAQYYQANTSWQCADCVSFTYNVEHILAWRPFPANAVETSCTPGEPPNFKAQLPREYLIKWADRSYKRVHWVPHGWLLATYPTKLKNFLSKGPHIPLLPESVADDAVDSLDPAGAGPAFGNDDEEMSEISDPARKNEEDDSLSLTPLPDAEKRVPPGWKTVDRVLDVLLWKTKAPPKKSVGKGKKAKRTIMVSDDEDSSHQVEELLDQDTLVERKYAYEDGEQPSEGATESIEEFEERTGRELRESDVDRVAWGFFKWFGLGYEEATWDSPSPRGKPGWRAFEDAFRRFLAARVVNVPALSRSEYKQFDERPKNTFMKKYKFTTDSQPQLGQDAQFKLMPFQVDGVNWLINNWWNLQHCILADEMGLGKTVQIVTFLGKIIQGWEGLLPSTAHPALVVVPNSTITNWVREFERWAPSLRVVPFYGDAKARDVIRQYELYHPTKAAKTTGAKFHVLVTTYETITNARDVGTLFKGMPRWEVLVVDEGQRLKSDASLLFKKLKELNTIHRVILTGTPLNNNIRELFNLMNFLDPTEWNDLENLAKEHEVLDETKIKELHNRLRPYFLRRIKSEVLQLPPKNEVIVPVSMTALQKEVYKSILSQNVEVLKSIALSAAGTKVNTAVKKSNMNNVLMQLRKCLQHPYLVSQDIEPVGLSPVESHEKLIGASAKLLMLKSMLPKLKERGHRVLLFSQFAIALNVIEDFLIGERIKYLRLDGNTKQVDRQKGMDEFNKPGSDVFIYILSTRAGGVGINLTTADTVIIFDPDFNPHQDLQAIARAHRFGQKKTCLVFKFMVKESAEERIMQTGKKKLVLDHLIVQNMDDNDGEKDVQSILLFGAQTLFEQGDAQSAKDIHYSENDIQHLIEKTEKEGDEQEPATGEGGGSFSFAKIWSAEQDVEDTPDERAQEDAWAQTLARIAEERLKEQAKEATGRGVRRKAAAIFPQQNLDVLDTPGKDKGKKGKGKQRANHSDDDEAFNLSDIEESDGQSVGSVPASDDLDISLTDKLIEDKKKKNKKIDVQGSPSSVPLSSIQNQLQVDQTCGLCGTEHPNRPCYLTESSENLAEYRRILTTMDSNESIEARRAAVAVIDETLHKRGKMKLIINQPLHPVERPSTVRQPQPKTSSRPSTTPVATAKPSLSAPQTHPMANGAGIVRSNGQASADSVAASSKTLVAKALPKPRPRAPAEAGPSSRRPPSPVHADEPPRKKAKESSGILPCPVCGQASIHPAGQCPIIKEGPERIETEIRRLRKDPTKTDAVAKLQRILLRLRSRPS